MCAQREAMMSFAFPIQNRESPAAEARKYVQTSPLDTVHHEYMGAGELIHALSNRMDIN